MPSDGRMEEFPMAKKDTISDSVTSKLITDMYPTSKMVPGTRELLQLMI